MNARACRGRILGLLAPLLLAFPGSAAAATPAPAGARLDLVLPLRADDAGLARFAQAVSTPGSPSYGAYEPIAMLARRFGAPSSASARVASFMRAAGARSVRVSPTAMYVEASMTVAQAQRTFHTTLSRYHGLHGDYIAPSEPSGRPARAAAVTTGVPTALRGLVNGVIGLSTAPVVPAIGPPAGAGSDPRASSPGAHALAADPLGPGPQQPPSGYEPATGTPGGCASALATHGFTPNQYLTAYGFDTLHHQGLSGQGERVALIEIDGFKPSDIKSFASCFDLRTPPISTTVVGASTSLPPGGESTLDLEVLTAAAPGLDQIEVYESGGDAAQVVDSFSAPLIKPGAKPQVLSASLGLCEDDMARSFGRAGIDQVERDVDLAASTGITLLSSSGDSGSSACQDPQGAPVDALAVNYPASSPYVTAVGGTNLILDSSNALADQVVWNDTSVVAAAGGGGISELFARPGYQKGFTSASGRAVPDVSALADLAPGYTVYCTAAEKGCSGWTTVGGTSAAAPLVAGGLALINQDLHRHSREFLGLINPLLYKIGADAPQRAQVFSDVTSIGNDLGPFISNSATPLGCCEAASGYDTASGWGSVNVAALDTVALQQLPAFGNVSLSIPRPQHVVRQRAIRVRLSCSANCRANVFGFISIGPSGGFNLQTSTYRFGQAATRQIKVSLTKGQLTAIRQGLTHHRRVVAELFGLALDARGQVAKVTAGVELRLG